MRRRLSFIDPSFRELYPLEPGIMCRLEGAPNAAKGPYSPDAFTLPAHYDAEFPPSATARG
jgi:hypothetical protein